MNSGPALVKAVLSDALPRFSSDVVGLVFNYLVYKTVSANAKPHLLAEYEGMGESDDAGGGWYKHSFVVPSPDGRQFWTPSKHGGVEAWSDDGKKLFVVAEGQHTFLSTRGVGFDSNGEVFISEFYSDRMAVCRLDGTFLRTFGSAGKAPGQFLGPWGVAPDGNGLIYVVDHGGNRVQLFNRAGEFVRFLVDRSQDLAAWLCKPTDIALSPNGEVVVLDSENHRVSIFSKQGAILRHINNPQRGVHSSESFHSRDEPTNEFHDCRGLCLDYQGNIFVSDTWAHRIHVSKPDSTFLTVFPPTNTDSTIVSTLALCFDHCNRLLVCVEHFRLVAASSRSVQVYAFL